mmetsp:Transcript_34005/g.58144  ORF Transcript_34005/g.58144 Transcript_34005/m.58144 type:complete len:248 (+) Transcript_34005:153-896(+)|eukprot:CAMPEP_0206157816 /NCGR_PEP_ID=MMETSP1474-20131121/4251_1 /ASSEMBLY_ACC=CAM_ASM_001110 /TAXON_ID=97495 /ORGANISM="Imantonia sp., Strain RCC918" /LENGTH=247 /DNA_ID=CAMNT_0053557569 /DNA_START=148 /DNA_END=891 /DNA_ORIENTATION=-
MVTYPRKKITALLALRALRDGTPGDFVETGLRRGGTAVLMLKAMLEYDSASPPRLFWGFDSFCGFPEDKNLATVGAKAEDKVSHGGVRLRDSKVGKAGELTATEKELWANFKTNKVDERHRLRIVKGWFNETLPRAGIGAISFLRLDGDLYVSTWDGLENLYPKLSVGGYIYIDDYGSYEGCKLAVNQYRRLHNITERMNFVNEEGPGSGKGSWQHGAEVVWWRKKHEISGSPRAKPETTARRARAA